MAKLANKLIWLLGARLARRQEQNAVQLLRIKAAMAYVKGIQAARATFLAYAGLLSLCILLGCGLILLHAGLFFYLPWPLRQRALLLLVLGAAYVLIPLIAFLAAARQRVWMRGSGADKIVERALQGKRLHGNDEETHRHERKR